MVPVFSPAGGDFVSVFELCFDAVVCGAGFIGFAAARRLSAKGHRVLLLEPGGDLLWESSRALENGAAAGSPSAAWQEWLEALKSRAAANGACFATAQAEMWAAHSLRNAGPELRTLLYAQPVAVHRERGQVKSLTVATKGGLRQLRAHRWIDATEEGLVARLCGPALRFRLPQACHRSVVVHSRHPEKLEAAVSLLGGRHPGLQCLPSFRANERRLRYPASAETPWHRSVVGLVSGLREILKDDGDFMVSHCGLREYPVYARGDEAAVAAVSAGNLLILSPSLRHEQLVSLADRYELGHGAGDRFSFHEGRAGEGDSGADASPELPAPQTALSADVAVIGAGTAGSVAAIAASRKGANTLALDFTSYPGGIGSGGGINYYFFGAPGGLQDEVDARTEALGSLLAGASASVKGWHHDAKKIALLEMFEESGVRFCGDSLLCGVECHGGVVKSITAIVRGEYTRISARAFVDSSGDGDLCLLAGADFRMGRPGDHRMLAFSQSAYSVKEIDSGFVLQSCNFDAGWVDPADPEDLSRARLTGISQHLDLEKNATEEIATLAPQLGLRQSRQIVTDRAVTLADMIAHARFPDSIGIVETIADTHSVDYEFESDDLAFYYWTCRGFRQRLRCDLPYRMLLPRGLANVWIACRAAGIDGDAFYGLRMQRDIQRLGEAGGIAAALAVSGGGNSRKVCLADLQAALDRSGARDPRRIFDGPPSLEESLAALDEGRPGMHLWHLYQRWSESREAVEGRLHSSRPRVSFYAAAVCAMGRGQAGEKRLLQAVENREDGPGPGEFRVPGPYGECIDLPFWLQATVLLRRIAGSGSIGPVHQLAARPDHPLNVRTTLALTLEQMILRLGADPRLIEAMESLLGGLPYESNLRPSRSLWRTLHDEPQKALSCDLGADTSEDHSWQLHLVASRIGRLLGRSGEAGQEIHRRDCRGFVRDAFNRSLDRPSLAQAH